MSICEVNHKICRQLIKQHQTFSEQKCYCHEVLQIEISNGYTPVPPIWLLNIKIWKVLWLVNIWVITVKFVHNVFWKRIFLKDTCSFALLTKPQSNFPIKWLLSVANDIYKQKDNTKIRKVAAILLLFDTDKVIFARND